MLDHIVTQICHFLSLFQKLFLQFKNIYDLIMWMMYVKVFDKKYKLALHTFIWMKIVEITYFAESSVLDMLF